MTAITLPQSLYDGAGYLWDIRPDGSILNGTYDAYDGGLYHRGFPWTWDGRTEDEGREVAIDVSNSNGILLTRKIYVPEDQGWARFLEIVTNTGPTTFTYSLYIDTNLGSDGGTVLVGTSSGDAVFNRNDTWVVTDDADGMWDPTMLHVVAGEDGLAPDSASGQYDNLTFRYDLRLDPGETQIVMHFAAQNIDQATALAKGPQLATLDLDTLTGMSREEMMQVVNFVLPLKGRGVGTAEDDIINGGARADTIYGLGGDDLLQSLDGDDTIIGGVGNDTLYGGAGDDVLKGGAGRDTALYDRAEQAVTVNLAIGTAVGDGADNLKQIENVVGSAFDDTLIGDSGDNRLTGGAGDDVIDGGGGRDTAVFSDAGTGVIVDLAAGTATGHGEDVLRSIESVLGTDYDDRLIGDDGVNWLTGRSGNDTLIGGDGNDTASFSYARQGVMVDLTLGTASGEGDDVLIGIEDVTGSAHDDVLLGDHASNRLFSLEGADIIIAGGGDDWVKGDAGNDTVSAGAGNDSIEAGDGDDIVDGGAGADTIRGDGGNDRLAGGEDDDHLWGDAGNDILAGDAGADSLNGGTGDDVLVGGAGNDTLVGDEGSDTVDFSAAPRNVSVSLELFSAYGDGADRLIYIENVTGSAYADTLWGNAFDNVLTGGGGDDMLVGGQGRDTFVFAPGSGADTIGDFQAGFDVIDLRAFVDDFATLAGGFEDLDGNTLVSYGDDSVLLLGVRATWLQATDFLLA